MVAPRKIPNPSRLLASVVEVITSSLRDAAPNDGLRPTRTGAAFVGNILGRRLMPGVSPSFYRIAVMKTPEWVHSCFFVLHSPP
jgi:hypothetical protein